MEEKVDFGSKEKAVSWKQWRYEKKQLHRKWREEKITKKLGKQKSKKHSELENQKKENPCEGRNCTLSIAVPGSILDNAQTTELQTSLAGQIARAATIFNVDEIVVFDETGSLTHSDNMELLVLGDKGYSNIQLSRILQYLECPQYLRKDLVPLHQDLKFAGLLNPLDAPHHLRASDKSQYREGVVVKRPLKEGKGSYVNIGLKNDVEIDKALQAGTRVTVCLESGEQATKHLRGIAVPPSTPRTDSGIYWGYTVRLAGSLSEAITECPFKGGYDLLIGTSDKGDNVDDAVLPPFKHLLIVFGGLGGLEASVDSDEMLKIEDPRFLFHKYLNTCPSQGSRTIRTEEAILITLSALRPKTLHYQCQR